MVTSYLSVVASYFFLLKEDDFFEGSTYKIEKNSNNTRASFVSSLLPVSHLLKKVFELK